MEIEPQHSRPKRTTQLPARYRDAMTDEEYDHSTAIVNALLAEELNEDDASVPHIYLTEFDLGDSEPNLL
jgi:hypothetical protein